MFWKSFQCKAESRIHREKYVGKIFKKAPKSYFRSIGIYVRIVSYACYNEIWSKDMRSQGSQTISISVLRQSVTVTLSQIGHQHFKLVFNTKYIRHPSLTSMYPNNRVLTIPSIPDSLINLYKSSWWRIFQMLARTPKTFHWRK